MTLSEFLEWFFRQLADLGIATCVMRNHERLPDENIGSDIDILVSREHMGKIADILLSAENLKITSFVARSYVSAVFVFGITVPGRNDHCLQLDFVHERAYKGLDYLDSRAVLDSAVPHMNSPCLRIPRESHEAIMSLLDSLLIGGWINERYLTSVAAVFEQCADEISGLLAIPFGKSLARELVSAVISGNHEVMTSLVGQMRVKLVLRNLARRPVHTIRALLRYALSEMQVRFTPEPLAEFCFLGVDGAGKSTVLAEVCSKFGARAKVVQVLHLKPTRGKTRVAVVSDPHALPPRGALISTAKLTWWLLLYHLNRFFHGRRNATVLLWDRYIYDVLVDPKRYRVSLGNGALTILAFLAPSPLAVFFLDVQPNVAYARKREVSLRELERARSGYLNVISKFQNAVVLNAELPVEALGDCVLAHVTDYLANHAEGKLRAEFKVGM